MRRLLTILTLILGTTLPASAATIEERIAAELQAQGYDIVEANRTWLGRLRIVAENDDIRRELVFNPGTGEILRDYSVQLTAPEKATRTRSGKSRPPRAEREPEVPADVVTGGGTLPEMPAPLPAAKDPEPVPVPVDEVDVVATPAPDAEPIAVPLLPAPLLPAAPPTGEE